MSDTGENTIEEQSVGYDADVGSEVGTEAAGTEVSELTNPTAAPSADGTTTPSISGKAKEMVIDAMKDPKNQEAVLNKAGEFMSDPKNQEMAKQGAAAGWSMIKGLGNSFYDKATGKAKKDEEAAAAAAAEQQRLEAEAAAAEQQRLDAEAAAAAPTGDNSTVSTDFTGLDSTPTYAPPPVPGATTGNSVELSINELNDNLEGAKATMMSVDPTTGVLNVAYEDADDAGDSVSQVGDSMSGGRKTKRRKQIKKNKSQKKKRKQTKKKGGKKKGGKKAKKSNTRKCA